MEAKQPVDKVYVELRAELTAARKENAELRAVLGEVWSALERFTHQGACQEIRRILDPLRVNS